ncbi:MAG: HipA domain-containing protein [Verrucomicrobiales bacterium]|nr:HipA domain-containing protein [Verrucomicrobiales bacterium]
MNRDILVYADWDAVKNRPALMGTLRTIETRGKEVLSFSYDREWLETAERRILDPDLQFFRGDQYLSGERPNFGLFLDSSPDRWGKVLMQRREAAMASSIGRKPKSLLESDYLLGVHDGQRMGGLRFKLEKDGPFLDNSLECAAPPSTSLRELENASWRVQDDNADISEVSKWISMLIAPGSSLGGARPKAGVRYPDGDLWIAKFPGRNDNRDMGAWEWIVWQLGKQSGLDLPPCECLKIGSKHRTFAVWRFDRVRGSRAKRRLHFASAMTLLGRTDGDNYHEGASYLELCELILTQGAHPEKDLLELWKRIVFSMFVSNTDDHLRNHGFLLEAKGWALSPGYDINAEPSGGKTGLSLNVNEVDNRLEPELAMEVAQYFRVKEKDALAIIENTRSVVANWRTLASEAKIGRAEQELMEPAFNLSHSAPKQSHLVESGRFWISKSGKRHSSKCRYYQVGEGWMGSKSQGTPCRVCGS